MQQQILPDDSDNGKTANVRPEAPVNRISQHLDAPDPFDPARLRLTQDFANSIGVKKVLTVVQCRKPNRHEFVRVRPGEEWHLQTGVFEDKVNRDTYLVAPAMWQELLDEVSPVCLFLTVAKQGDVFLWPCKLPGADGRRNSWNESALAAAQLAESKWVRIAANMPGGMYDTYEAAGELADPTWPELSLRDILEMCFKQRQIESVDHPAIRALRGLT
jgi:hypothetical protein